MESVVDGAAAAAQISNIGAFLDSSPSPASGGIGVSPRPGWEAAPASLASHREIRTEVDITHLLIGEELCRAPGGDDVP